MSYLTDGLNEEQLKAVETTEGYIRVIAGAGSGKTRALSHRFAYLVKELGIMPSNIMCVTFTNKAANEMKKRIRKLIGDNDCGYVSTFHGFCVSLLKEDGHYIHYPKTFIILDTEDTDAILKGIYEEQGLTLRDSSFADARQHINYCKNKRYPDYYKYFINADNRELHKKYMDASEAMEKIFWGYVYHQKKMFALDYFDLILLALYILQSSEEIRHKWQERLEYIMVDEFQDIDLIQYSLVSILSDYHKNLFVVGDPDQTIYSWRGADVSFITEFDKNFPNTQTIILNKNYRSSSNILDVSNSLIKKNRDRIPKELVSMKGNNVPVIYSHTKTNSAEADWILQQINTILESGNKLSDIAILYRAHYLSRPIEEKLIQKNIPYTLYSGIQFYQRKEIKDILSYMRLIAYKDDLSFKRIVNEPKRNIGKAKMEFLKKYAEEHSCSLFDALADNADTDIFKQTRAREFTDMIEKYSTESDVLSLSELLSRLLNDSGYEEYLRTNGEQERLDNLAEFKFSIFDFESTFGEDISLDEYLSRIALYTNTDLTVQQDTVKMMTIHTAKGLEFPFVFVCGMNEGVFPSRKVKKREDLEEERRLAYVAFTRAEDALFITDSEGKNLDGSYRYPSRFIFNVEKKYLSYVVELDEKLVFDAEWEIEKSEKDMDFDIDNLPFAVGDMIRHKVFGNGTISEIDKENQVYVVRFDGMPTERRLSVKTTSLEKASEGNRL